MLKKIYFLLIVGLFLSFLSTSATLAATKGAGEVCTPAVDSCPSGYSCERADPVTHLCQKSNVFGKITPPDALLGFIGTDQTGAAGISKLLSNMVTLIYSLAAVVLILMFLWGAFDWITSEGDKEKVQSAQKKIVNAIIGILLFAVAFAVIGVLGQFTGFKFFAGQQ